MSFLQDPGLDNQDFDNKDLDDLDLDENDLDYRDLYDPPSQVNSDANDSDTSSNLGSDGTGSEENLCVKSPKFG